MTINPLVAGALLILFVTFWFVAGVVDGTRPEPMEARATSAEPSHQRNHERQLAHH